MFKRADILILISVLISFAFSIYLWFLEDKTAGLFVGIWVPSILALGIYVKLMTKDGRRG